MPLAAMSVSEVLTKRFSVRAFRDTPVPQTLLEEIFTLAQSGKMDRAGKKLEALKKDAAVFDYIQDEANTAAS